MFAKLVSDEQQGVCYEKHLNTTANFLAAN